MTPHRNLTACAIFRDEAAFLAEWIVFHRLVGVEHFHLYDNGSSDAPEKVLLPFIDAGIVTLHAWPVPFHEHAARRAYADCLERVRGSTRWLTCIDIDEFLFSPASETLTPILRDYEHAPAVVVRWQVYGSGGEERASEKPVIERFVRRAPSGWVRNQRVKSIVDPSRTLRPLDAHHFEFAGNLRPVDETGEPVGLRPRPPFKKRLRPLYPLLGPALSRVDPYSAARITRKRVSVERLRINHYPVKSREEFLRKSRFKREKRRYQGVDYFAYHDRNDVHDPILTAYLPALGSELARVMPAR